MLLPMPCEAPLVSDSPNREVTSGGHQLHPGLIPFAETAWPTPRSWTAYKPSYRLQS